MTFDAYWRRKLWCPSFKQWTELAEMNGDSICNSCGKVMGEDDPGYPFHKQGHKYAYITNHENLQNLSPEDVGCKTEQID